MSEAGEVNSERGTESIESARMDARRVMRDRERLVRDEAVIAGRAGCVGSANFTDARFAGAVGVLVVVLLTKIDVVDFSLPSRRAEAVELKVSSRWEVVSMDLVRDPSRRGLFWWW